MLEKTWEKCLENLKLEKKESDKMSNSFLFDCILVAEFSGIVLCGCLSNRIRIEKQNQIDNKKGNL